MKKSISQPPSHWAMAASLILLLLSLVLAAIVWRQQENLSKLAYSWCWEGGTQYAASQAKALCDDLKSHEFTEGIDVFAAESEYILGTGTNDVIVIEIDLRSYVDRNGLGESETLKAVSNWVNYYAPDRRAKVESTSLIENSKEAFLVIEARISFELYPDDCREMLNGIISDPDATKLRGVFQLGF
ncbi:MAG: hypothetical protein R3F11_23910 [Verrucomicrobiales bacterium]